MKFTENKILGILLLIIFLFNTFPYFYQHFNNVPGKIYIGSFPILLDQPFYLAEMAQGQNGYWFIIDRFTNEPQQPTLVYIFYAFLGQLSQPFHLSLESTLLASRFVFGFILILAAIFFLRYFIKEKKQRIFAYLLTFFASGLGWLSLGRHSLDLFMPDLMPLVRFSYFPHMAIATTLFLLTIVAIHKSLQEKKSFWVIVAGALTFILNIILPFNSILLYPVVLLYIIFISIKNKSEAPAYLKNFLIFFVISFVSFLYMFYLKQTNPIWRVVEQENILLSPQVYEVFLGFGLILFFMIMGLYLMYLKKKPETPLFIIWSVLPFFLAFIPTAIMPIQRRFFETGLFVPLAVPASFALFQFYQYLQKKYFIFFNKPISYIFLIFFLLAFIILPGNLKNVLQFQKFIRQNDNPFIYVSQPIYQGIKWLEENTPANSIILSSFYNGNLIPYLAKRTVYVGHGPGTIHLAEKMEKINDFYLGFYDSPATHNFLESENINYILYSEHEKKNPDFHPEQLNFLVKVYDQKNVEIYQFIK